MFSKMTLFAVDSTRIPKFEVEVPGPYDGFTRAIEDPPVCGDIDARVRRTHRTGTSQRIGAGEVIVQPHVGIDEAHAAAAATDGLSASATANTAAKASAILMLVAFLTNPLSVIISGPPAVWYPLSLGVGDTIWSAVAGRSFIVCLYGEPKGPYGKVKNSAFVGQLQWSQFCRTRC
jgi:hypothetical protein